MSLHIELVKLGVFWCLIKFFCQEYSILALIILNNQEKTFNSHCWKVCDKYRQRNPNIIEANIEMGRMNRSFKRAVKLVRIENAFQSQLFPQIRQLKSMFLSLSLYLHFSCSYHCCFIFVGIGKVISPRGAPQL